MCDRQRERLLESYIVIEMSTVYKRPSSVTSFGNSSFSFYLFQRLCVHLVVPFNERAFWFYTYIFNENSK